jgi:hypothetical protein
MVPASASHRQCFPTCIEFTSPRVQGSDLSFSFRENLILISGHQKLPQIVLRKCWSNSYMYKTINSYKSLLFMSDQSAIGCLVGFCFGLLYIVLLVTRCKNRFLITCDTFILSMPAGIIPSNLWLINAAADI